MSGYLERSSAHATRGGDSGQEGGEGGQIVPVCTWDRKRV